MQMILVVVILLILIVIGIVTWLFLYKQTPFAENYHFLLINRDPLTDQKYLIRLDRYDTDIKIKVDQYVNGYASRQYEETLPPQNLGETALLIQTPFIEIRNDVTGPIIRLDTEVHSFEIDVTLQSTEGALVKLKGNPRYYGYLLYTQNLPSFERTLQTDDTGNIIITQETQSEIKHITPDVSPSGTEMTLAGSLHTPIVYKNDWC